MSTTPTFANGTRVNFKPGPRSTARMAGTVKDTVTSGEGKGRKTFLLVGCEDGRDRKVMPGAARAA